MVEEELADPSRVLVCYNGLAAERFPVRPTPVPEAPPVIGLVCVLRPEKGLPILLEAFAAVSRTHPEAQLLIVGSGPEKDSLAALASTLGIASKCEWHPAAADVSPWLQRIDIFVLPSESEAFSNSLLEAMASGCAVIASAVGGTPELVETDQTGLLFPRRDAAALAQCLDRLLSSRADRLRLGTAAAAKVRDAYSISRSVATLDQIYSAVARSA
jgi:glycosyltransferase involved in cell wall biosynthesis